MDQQQATKLFVAGGDGRFPIVAGELRRHGYTVSEMFFDAEADRSLSFSERISHSDIVILPLPAVRDGSHLNIAPHYLEAAELKITQTPTLSELLMKLREGQLILGGMLPAWFIRRCEEGGARAADYFADDELEIMNLVPTVEGCLGLIITSTDKTLFGMKVLVTGYGKLGRLLCRYLKHMGASVTAAARKETDLAWIAVDGCRPVTYGQLADSAGEYDLILNTVPARVIGEEILKNTAPDCRIIDLASNPGGVDTEVAKELHRSCVRALSLPGQTAPVTAAHYLTKAIIKQIRSVKGEVVNDA